MGALAHLVPLQNPALGTHPDQKTEGSTWRWVFEDLLDSDGELMDFSTMGTLTCLCTIEDATGVIVTPVYTATGAGSFELSVDESLTDDLVADGLPMRGATWHMSLDDGTDTVQFWAPNTSPFKIFRNSL